MGLVRAKDTKPELRVRVALRSLGYRYRTHQRRLLGTPDVVLPSQRKVIFVHGCFWHRHKGCSRTRVPKSRVVFWQRKFEENVARDRRVRRELAKRGWRSTVIWECLTEKPDALRRRLLRFLELHPERG